MLNNVPLSERSARPPGGLLFHPPLLLFPWVPRHRKASLFPDFFPFFAPIDPAPLLKRGTLLSVGPACRAWRWFPRMPAPPKPAIPAGGELPCRSPKLPSANRKTCPVGLGDPPEGSSRHRGKIYCLQEQTALPLGGGPAVGSRGGGTRTRPTRPHAGKGGKASRLLGLLLHTHTHIYIPKTDWVFFFFLSPSPLLHPPMLFFTSAFVCKWQESKLLFLLPLRFKWSWQIKPS